MNERMKALAVEADFMLCEDGHFYSEGQSQKITDGLQKFAELIVRECASLCEINGNTYKYSFTPAKAMLAESASKYCGTMIKKHFGVEE
jgi:hypothetical protein